MPFRFPICLRLAWVIAWEVLFHPLSDSLILVEEDGTIRVERTPGGN